MPNHTEVLVRSIAFPSKMFFSCFPNRTASTPPSYVQSHLLGFQSVSALIRYGHLSDPMRLLLLSGDLDGEIKRQMLIMIKLGLLQECQGKNVHTYTSLLSKVGKNCVMSHQLYSRLVG